jgi:hypothetical protein
MAKMYGQLPSYVLEHGTTFDILATNALAEYEQSLLNSGGKVVPHLSQQEMMDMIKAVRQ